MRSPAPLQTATVYLPPRRARRRPHLTLRALSLLLLLTAAAYVTRAVQPSRPMQREGSHRRSTEPGPDASPAKGAAPSTPPIGE